MGPNVAVMNGIDKRDADAKFGSYGDLAFAGCRAAAYFCDLIFIQLGIAVIGTLGAYTTISAALFDHIAHVVLMAAQKEVRDADTSRIIAFVQNPQPVRYGAVFEFPCKTMGADVAVPICSQDSITPIGRPACPLPTGVAIVDAVDLGPKAFLHRWVLANADAMPSDKSSRLAFDVTALGCARSRDWGRLTTSALAQLYNAGAVWFSVKASAMTVNVANRFALDAPKLHIGLRSEWCRLAAATQAQPGWVGQIWGRSSLVSSDVRQWLALDSAIAFARACSDGGLLPATAFAVTVGNFVGGVVCDKLAHVVRSFKRSTVPQAAYDSAAVFSLA